MSVVTSSSYPLTLRRNKTHYSSTRDSITQMFSLHLDQSNMKFSLLGCLCFFLVLSLQSARALFHERAGTPPRGWNSYDSFSWIISEEEFLQNAEIIARRLKPHGYEYVVVDYLWYRRKVPGAYSDAEGYDVIDEWGRPQPDPGRWPSSRNGKGFTEVANRVHGMGLKFGIHVMRGLSLQAYNANTPILDITTGRTYEESGRKWTARDIGLKERACAWMPHGFMSVNTKLGAGRAFLRSLYYQYAKWNVDFVKHDCVFGDDLDINEISYVSQILKGLKQPILYSLSPGTSVTPVMAKQLVGLVNMYRVTGDDWDTWGDVAAHFNVARDFSAANMIGAKGLLGKSWPDLDMLPLGLLTDPGSNGGPHRKCGLTIDEQKTQVTLWSIAKSPLMFGGDVRNLDETTYNLITNPVLLEINSFSSKNTEFPYITGSKSSKSRKACMKHPRRCHENASTIDGYAMGLTSCEDYKTDGWSIETLDRDLEQVCWKEKLTKKFPSPFCLYKRHSLRQSDEKLKYKNQYEGKLHLLATDRAEFCLDGSAKRRLSSKETKRGSFSPCRWDANQLWELHGNGTLVNSYSGLCAVVNRVKGKGTPGGIRSWVAAGRRGEIYVAFFNLTPDQMVISAKISDLYKALGRKHKPNTSCKGRDIWSGINVGPEKQKIAASVATHGCALFALNCS